MYSEQILAKVLFIAGASGGCGKSTGVCVWISGMPGAGETGKRRVIADELDSGETSYSVKISGAWEND